MHSLRNFLLITLVLLCSSSLLKAQCLDPVPVLQFSPNNACSGTAITFEVINLSPANDETYSWNFGDGTTTPDSKLTANGSKVTYAYNHTGTGPANFTVSVRRVKGLCVYDSAPQTVTVKPQVAFTPPTVKNNINNSANVCVADTVQNISVTATLTNPNTSTTGISGYQVDWGNGEVNNYTLAQFTGSTTISNGTPYNKEGNYPITVTALSTDPNVCPAVVNIPFSVGKDPKAVFSVEKKERIEPQFPSPLCGVPVRVEIKNESTGGGLTYKWEVTNTQPGGPVNFSFIEGTSDTTKNPVFQFNEKGRYMIKLTVSNACVDPSDPVGPIDPYDPENPDDDFDEDGKYVQEESVLIVYPEVQIQGRDLCADPGVPQVIMGNELAQFDPNLGTIDPSTIQWVVTGGATLDNPNIQNPKITFPGPGTYTVAANFANECERSQDAPGANQRPPATITITARPSKPADGSVTLCGGENYVITPTPNGSVRFNFYTTATGGSPVASDTTAYPINAVTNSVTYYIAAVLNGCESSERGVFTLNVLPPIQNNTIQAPQSICVGATPAPLTGTQPSGANGNFSYTWLRSTTSATTGFTVAPGVNNGSGYTPAALTQTTWFRRMVRATSCKPDTSAAVEITVVPVIATNTITQNQTVCAGSAPATLIGSRPTGGNGVDYAIIWESSTTGATATDFAPVTGANGTPVINNEENLEPGPITQTTWYRRQVTSAGCSGYSNVIVITVAPALAQNTIGSSQTICGNAAPTPLTGSKPTGGTGTYTYLWESSTTSATDGFGPAAGTNTGITYNPGNLTQTTHFRRTVTSGSCEPLVSEAVTITVVPAIENNTITAAKTVVCEGAVPVLTGSLATGGSGNLVYLWESSVTSASAGFNPAIGTNNGKDYTPTSIVQNTWYRRTVSVAGSTCPPIISNIVAVTVDKLPAAPTVEASDVTICAGTSATLRVTSTNGGTYQWFTAETGGNPVSFEPVFVTPVLTSNITYYVQATNNNQCVSATRTPVKVTVTSISADAGRDTTIIEGQPFGLRATGGTTYVWSPATGLNDPNVATPIATPTKTTTYTVTVTTEDGCTATDEITITVIPRVVVVNTFSPNGDNINDTWEIKNIENFPNATVEVFNRWGNPVFKSDVGYRQPWDGTHKGSILPLATYYYIIRLDNISKPISGSITIIR
ncbi:MAG: gliding motility-associated C-terminal domain-containing protein [Adhaeribacter sp.]